MKNTVENFTISKTATKRICFAGIAGGEHIIPLHDIRLFSQVIEISLDIDKEPDNIVFFVVDGMTGEKIKVNAVLWTELHSYLMEGK